MCFEFWHSALLVGSGVAHAVSPDVRFRHPAFSSLGAVCALGIHAFAGRRRRLNGMGNPFRDA
jgi:hypothetical protein